MNIVLLLAAALTCAAGEIKYANLSSGEGRWFETRVRQADGAELFTYGVVPAAGAKCPVIVVRTPYDGTNAADRTKWFAREADTLKRGYAKVVQQCRGSALSTGVRVPYVDERRDSLAMLAFARTLPCYNGELFVEGGSYVSSVHWAYLDDCPADVKGAVLNIQCANRYPVVMHNGFVKTGLHVGWFTGEYKKNVPGFRRNRQVPSWEFPFCDFTRRVFGAAEGPIAGVDDILSHPRPEDPFWQTPGGAGGEYRRAFTHSKIPILMRTGWFDIYADALCDQWREATAERKANCALVIDAFDHGGRRKGEATNATSVVHFPDGSRYDEGVRTSALDWFDYVRGGAAPKNVNVGGVAWYNMWENKWHRSKEVPAGERPLALSVKGAAERAYRYDPRNPARFPLGCGIGFGGLSRMPKPDFRPDVLSYLLDPVEATTDVAGRMLISLQAKSDCEDSSFYVRVSLKKTGTDVWYGLRESIKSLTWDAGDYKPGAWRTMRFELADIAFRLEKGDQLRVDVSSSNAAMFAPHGNVKGLQAFVREPKVANNAVSAEGPVLTLPCRGGKPIIGYMLDISRFRVPTMATVKRQVDILAELGYNHLQLYTEHTFAYRGHETAWREASPFTPEEIRELDAYCAARGIELVPNQNSFGHLERWLKHPEYNHLAETPQGGARPWGGTPKAFPMALCPTDPKSVDFVAGLYDQLFPCFKSKYVNVGCDEVMELVDKSNPPVGRSAAEVKAKGAYRVYLDFLKKLYGLVRDRDHEMMFFADMILYKPEMVAELPGESIALDWGYEKDHPFAKETDILRKCGIRFVVCPGTSTWCSLLGRTDIAFANIDNAIENGEKNGAMGALLTDWEQYPNPWSCSLPSIVYFARRMRGEKPTRAEVAAEVDRIAGCRVGESLMALGDVYRKVSDETPWFVYVTSLRALLIKGEDYPWGKNKSTREAFKVALADWKTARAKADLKGGAWWIADDFAVIDLIEKAVSMRVNEPHKPNFKATLEPEYRRLWLRQSRPGGLTEVVDTCFHSR